MIKLGWRSRSRRCGSAAGLSRRCRDFGGSSLEWCAQRQLGLKIDAVLADERSAMNVGRALAVGAGETAGYFPATKGEIESRRFGVLVDDHLAAPLSDLMGVGAGVIEEGVAAHDAPIAKHDDAGGAALLAVTHFDGQGVKPVLHGLTGRRFLVHSNDGGSGDATGTSG